MWTPVAYKEMSSGYCTTFTPVGGLGEVVEVEIKQDWGCHCSLGDSGPHVSHRGGRVTKVDSRLSSLKVSV